MSNTTLSGDICAGISGDLPLCMAVVQPARANIASSNGTLRQAQGMGTSRTRNAGTDETTIRVAKGSHRPLTCQGKLAKLRDKNVARRDCPARAFDISPATCRWARGKKRRRPEGTIENGARIHFNRPYGTRQNTFILPISPAVHCWANIKRPCGTDSLTSTGV